jgi:predicted Rossmann fold flavoprotein
MAAIFAARAGAKTVVVEGNTTAGRKLLVTGGGRCNLTHAGAPEDFVRAYGLGGRFLQHCLHELSPEKTQKFFAVLGLQTQVQPDGCVFPITQRASSVRDVLLSECQKTGVQFVYGKPVEGIDRHGDGFSIHCGREVIEARRVIIATGGVSWPQTGSRGDGYRFARKLGHTVIEPRAALVPLVTREKWCGDLAGTSVDCVRITAKVAKNKITVTGAILFTQDGIGGPAAQDLSRGLADYLPAEKDPIEIAVDLSPKIREADLEKRLLDDFAAHPKKSLGNVLADLAPRRLAEVLCREFGLDGDTIGGQLKKVERRRLLKILKGLPLSILATRPIEEATVTRGGVSRDEIDPRTMESKICPDLFFAGEVIDVDGPCGGYNLQACWSTGALAGRKAAEDG